MGDWVETSPLSSEERDKIYNAIRQWAAHHQVTVKCNWWKESEGIIFRARLVSKKRVRDFG